MDKCIWQPTQEAINDSNMMEYFRTIASEKTDYDSMYRWSINNPKDFWLSLTKYFSINFHTPPASVVNNYQSFLEARWFSGASLNFAEHLLQRRDDAPAIIFHDEKNNRRCLSFEQLYTQVASVAEAMRNAGVKKGHRVAAVLPNMPETIIAMLAATSIGAIWSSCSPDFGYRGIMDRFAQIQPKLLLTCDGYYYNGKTIDCSDKHAQVSRDLDSVSHTIIIPFINSAETSMDAYGDKQVMLWDDFQTPRKEIEFASVEFNHPIYIMFSSGTTGKPKCIVHGTGGTLLQHLKELSLHSNLKDSDNLFFFTTCGWMMWNWMASALALGTTLTLYDGCPTYPDANRLFDIIDSEKVSAFGTSAKFISAVEKEGLAPSQSHKLSHLKTIFSTGSPLLPANYDFVYDKIKKDVQLSSISGGTDILSCFALGNPLKPVYRGELQSIGLGMAVEVYNHEGKPIIHDKGELVCTQPFPSMPLYFWEDPNKNKYQEAYFTKYKGVWSHGDYAEITEHNGLIIYGRSDATLNPGGVRIGTAEIYRQVEKISAVTDSVVIGQQWIDDVRLVLFVKLQQGLTLDEALIQQIKQTIKENATPRHVPAVIVQVDDIPKTVSGKTVELAVRNVVHGEVVENLNSLANPQSLEQFKNRPELS